MDKLLVLTTGGTLDKVYFDALSDFQVGDPVVTGILRSMNVAFEFNVQEICRKDSLELIEEDREKMAKVIKASDAKFILVTHGTDTMVESATYLQAQGIGEQAGQVIIFTGAMQPSRFTDSDATFNIGLAIGAMSVAKPGIYIAMSGKVYEANKVFKNYDSRRFEAE